MNNSSAANFHATDAEREFIFSTKAIRERAEKMLQFARDGKTHFSVHEENLKSVAEFVAKVTREKYPTLDIPFHSRWGHFDVGGVKRVAILNKHLDDCDALERLKAKIDLAVVSVLLDAGSGPKWKYVEKASGLTFNRSEGLAVASLHMFLHGDFSDDPLQPFRVDANRLCALGAAELAQGFQVTPDDNPLAGFEGRLLLLRSLGEALQADKELFFDGTSYRPGNIITHLIGESKTIPAIRILRTLQRGLGRIWPGRVTIEGQNMGDVWPYAPFGQGLAGLVPFHKLSQWLSYSLIEPIIESGVYVTNFEQLTGLAEYRNGGLIVDKGLIQLRDPALATAQSYAPSSDLIIEWRSLTIAMLDRLGEAVRVILGKSADEFPLGKVLEGGTWWAGRIAAAEKRPGGTPPFSIESDGTVF